MNERNTKFFLNVFHYPDIIPLMTWFAGLIQPISYKVVSMPIIDGVLTLSTDPGAFITWFLAAGLGLGGGICLILVTVGGYRILTSGGDPAAIKDGKEQIQNAIIGLLLIILSFAIVKTIFDLLGINVVNFS